MLTLVLAAPVEAGIILLPGVGTVYTDTNKTDFMIAAPGLTLVDFATTSQNTLQSCNGPFDSVTNNACFLPGDIAPGISADAVNLGGGGLMLRAPTGTLQGNSIDVVGPNSPADDLSILLTGGPNSFGGDFLSLTERGSGLLSISVADLNGVFATTDISIGTGPTTFYGIISNRAITSLKFTIAGIAEGIGNAQFGTVQMGGSSGGGTNIPEPGTLLLTGLGFAAALRLGRRRTK